MTVLGIFAKVLARCAHGIGVVERDTRVHCVIFCGGIGFEHEISLISAYHIAKSMPSSIRTSLLFVSRTRDFLLMDASAQERLGTYTAQGSGEFGEFVCTGTPVTLLRRGKNVILEYGGAAGERIADPVDVAFPIIHGTTGEDGIIQGFLEFLGLPYVGCDVLSSALCMNKVRCKEILERSGIPVVPWAAFSRNDALGSYDALVEQLKSRTLFVKPASQGSSVGISVAGSACAFEKACQKAFCYDSWIIVEQAMKAREIETAVLGSNKSPCVAPVFGEIIPSEKHGFYSYEAKYVDSEGAALSVPASVTEAQQKELSALAEKAFQKMGCSGMARIDFFVTPTRVFLNEINTLPGFTPISMYPLMWAKSGLPVGELLAKLIALAQERSSTSDILSAVRVA